MRLPRSPYKRAEAAIDSWDYESEEGQEKARTAAVFTIPAALILLVLVIAAIVMHLAGAFNPERDAYQEAQSHVEDITRRSERGLDKTRTDKPANGDTTDWTLFHPSPTAQPGTPATSPTTTPAFHSARRSKMRSPAATSTSRPASTPSPTRPHSPTPPPTAPPASTGTCSSLTAQPPSSTSPT